jgi:hypothetical protein
MSYELDNPSSFWMLYEDTRTDFEKAVSKPRIQLPLNPFQSTKYEKFPIQRSQQGKLRKKKAKRKVFILDENGDYIEEPENI